MAKKNTRNTRGKIIDAAWQLFYCQGYDDTTVEEIIEASGTSRGSFYHYFQGKDALLSTLADVFDRKYEELMETLDPEQDRFEQLMYLNRELFAMLENSISLDLAARLYSYQLVTRGDKSLLDHNRTYYRLLRQTVLQPAAGGAARRCHRKRDRPGLRPVRAGPHLRLVSVRGGLLPVPVRKDHDAHVSTRLSGETSGSL